MAKVLIVDDDKNICQLLALYLEKDGHQLVFAHDGSEAMDLFHQTSPELVLLDQMLPLISGREVCALIRRESQIPVLMLTAVGQREEKISALDAGADDYIVKPFEPLEVAARVRAHLRKAQPASPSPAGDSRKIGKLSVSIPRFEVLYDGKKISMTPREVQLLDYLLRNAGLVLSREMILENVWGFDYLGETRTIDMHIRNLRSKIPADPDFAIRTVVGIGYKLERIS